MNDAAVFADLLKRFEGLRDRGWRVDACGGIRDRFKCCPVEALAGTGPNSSGEAARALGRPFETLAPLFCAADQSDCAFHRHRHLRPRLLHALGMEPGT